jgi:hypothetical protein
MGGIYQGQAQIECLHELEVCVPKLENVDLGEKLDGSTYHETQSET